MNLMNECFDLAYCIQWCNLLEENFHIIFIIINIVVSIVNEFSGLLVGQLAQRREASTEVYAVNGVTYDTFLRLQFTLA